ncbi:DUF4349 domain-containing protein [Microbacterium excoecariae]|uniref:DUF4349 domain-containing protein n=1 Tax=Microbacterium excoecariae TaxID=2715210 RepID=UPI00140897EF|nr:DUF4349 domain-containing protein [Microbacterium excoecariae]NHI15651.1 DUF4349 domain-containing protein [Microbacterium excoecariae]
MDDVTLPPVSDERVRAMETATFDRIRTARSARTRRRRWAGAGIAAAAVVVAAVAIVPLVSPPAGQSTADEAIAPGGGYVGEAEMLGDAEALPGDAVTTEVAPDGAAADAASEESAAAAEREIIRTASATVVVPDVARSADDLVDLAAEYDGYVESLGVSSADPTLSSAQEDARTGWASLRIPAASLDAARADLAELGEVTATSVSQDDVTDQAIDLAARIEASEASVGRLTELMAQAESVSDLLDAERALAERQAELEAYRGQLEQLEGQVDMATLYVDLVREQPAGSADPGGFSDGLLAGWNGFVGFLNGLVIAVGFLVPWLAAAAVVAAVVWAVVRIRRRARG